MGKIEENEDIGGNGILIWFELVFLMLVSDYVSDYVTTNYKLVSLYHCKYRNVYQDTAM